MNPRPAVASLAALEGTDDEQRCELAAGSYKVEPNIKSGNCGAIDPWVLWIPKDSYWNGGAPGGSRCRVLLETRSPDNCRRDSKLRCSSGDGMTETLGSAHILAGGARATETQQFTIYKLGEQVCSGIYEFTYTKL